MVYKLLKVLHKLKQALRLWYERLFNFFLKKLGFEQININHSIFISVVIIDDLIINTFVCDIKIIRAKNSKVIS